jgi:hypothetical protein
MNVNWKYLSSSLIISFLINGISGLYVLIKSRNQLVTYLEKIVSQYPTNVSEHIEGNKISITLAQGSGFSLEIWILFFVLSFVLITILSYVLICLLSKRK